jgi:p-cumate 2,3-dioxygenase alpha subunit
MTPSEMRNLIVDDREHGRFKLDRRAFWDENVIKAERDNIFNRCWLYAGHHSELPNRGDYIARKVGGKQLILTRGRDGEIRVFLNACPHRGMMLCREKSGNTGRFTCFYHGWSFATTGKLIGLTDAEGYSESIDRTELGLVPVPRVDHHRGLVFISFDPDIVSLASYLGNAVEYIDYMIDFGGGDIEIAQGAQSYAMKANWKLLVENSIDALHGMSTHHRFHNQFLPDMGLDSTTWMTWAGERHGRGVALDNGHAFLETPFRSGPMAKTAADKLAGLRATLDGKFGTEQASRIADYGRNLFIFPNLIFVSTWRTIRTFYPISPDYLEIDAWAMLPTNEDEELKRIRLDNFISFLGPAGFGTPDDAAALEACQRGMAGADGRQWSDISRGMKRDAHAMDELQMRGFWRRWHEMVNDLPPSGYYGDRIGGEGKSRAEPHEEEVEGAAE